jgi:pyridoxal 5'-phosphate synthase glutaminase subunit Pdx2
MKAGVLALQGDFREHAAVLSDLGASPVLVRSAEDLASVDCLSIPGGESTTIGRLAGLHGLVEPIRERAKGGMPVLGTCAGMIVMAREVDGGEPLLSLMDIRVARNAYGRPADSCEAAVESAAFVLSALAGGVLAQYTSERFTYFATVPLIAMAVIGFLRFKEPRLHQAAERVSPPDRRERIHASGQPGDGGRIEPCKDGCHGRDPRVRAVVATPDG